MYSEIFLQPCLSSQYNAIQFRTLLGQMPWFTIAETHCCRWYMADVALPISQLYSIFLVDGCLCTDIFTDIWWHTGCYCCRCQFYVPFVTVRPELYVQCQGAQTGVCVVAEYHLVAQFMKWLSFNLIRIPLYLAEVFVELWFAVVEKQKKMTTERSGKFWGIYCQLQLKMEWVTANLHDLLKMNTAFYHGRLHGFPIFLRSALSQSDIVCLFTTRTRG